MENNKTIIRDKTGKLDKINKMGIKGLYLDGVRRMFTAVLLLLLYTTAVQLQAQTYTGHNMVVDSTFTKNGQYIFKATESIRLRDGFKFTSGNSKTFNGKIDANMILPHDELYVTPSPIVYIPIDSDLYFGTTAGVVDVSAMGGATYTIPIDISPGTNGVQPQISLVYNSQSGKGIAGMGWSISGLSAINRVGKAKYLDGVNDRVNLDYEDRFIWDGQRLMLFDGEYGENNSEYRTEIESYNKIYARGTSGNGPEYFEVQMPDGSIMYYGKTDESRVKMNNMTTPSSFMISEMKDAYSNYIKYNYGKEGDETYIESIEYTGNYDTVMLPYNKIEFYYDIRSDENTFYFKGSKNTSKLILREIRCLAFGEVYRRYKLTYYNKDNMSFLYSIQEFAGDGTKYNPTHFEYGHENIYLSKDDVEMSIVHFPEYIIAQNYFGDFNNDGITDILQSYYAEEQGENPKLYLYGFWGSQEEGGFSTQCFFAETLKAKERNYYIIVDDFNNDGYSDFALFFYKRNSEDKNNDDSIFIDTNKNILSDNDKADKLDFRLYIRNINSPNVFDIMHNSSTEFKEIHDIRSGDITANGFKDLVIVGQTGGKNDISAYAYILKHTTDLRCVLIDTCYTKNMTINLENLEGRDRLNVLISKRNVTNVRRYSISNIGVIVYNQLAEIGYPTHWHKQYYGDFNGDGLKDILTWNNISRWYVGYYNDNFHFEHASVSFMNQEVDLTQDDCEYRCFVYDFNKDGLDDIMEMYTYYPVYSDKTNIIFKLHYSTGDGFTTMTHRYEGYFPESRFYVRNVTPIFCNTNSYERFLIPAYISKDLIITSNNLWLDGGSYPALTFGSNDNNRLLTKTKDGTNNIVEIVYKSCMNNLVYTNNNDGNNYPIIVKTLPINIVYQIKYGHTITSRKYITSYNYKNLRLHLEGKGLLCFDEVTKINNTYYSNGNIIYYDINNERYYPIIKKTETILAEQPLITLTRTENKTKFNKGTLDKSNIYNLTIVQDTIILMDYNDDIRCETVIEYDLINMPINKTVKTYSSRIGSNIIQTFVENTSYTSPITGLFAIYPDTIIKTLTKTGETSISNKLITNYNNNGSVNSKIQQYSIVPTEKDVIKSYIYNSFGKAIFTNVSGGGVSRNSSATYDDKGRFVISKSDALGYTTNTTNDRISGNILTLTDKNGFTINYKYDSFGQLIQIISPSGIITETYCDWITNLTNGDIPDRPSYPILFYRYEKTSGAPTQFKFYDYYGNLLRTAVQEPYISDYNWLYSDIEYDTINRVVREFIPHYGSWSKWTKHEYISSGRYSGNIFKLISPDNSYLKYEYDVKKIKKNFNDGTTDKETIETVDALGNLISVDEPGGMIVYDYYSDGNVKSVTCTPKNGGAASTTTFEYDAMGNRTKINDPDAGIIKTRYNVFGEVTEQQSAEQANLGKYIRTYYDNGGRVTSQKTVTGDFNSNSGSEVNLISYLYSENIPTKGMLLSETSTTAKKEYSYDEYLRLSQVTETVLTDGKSFTFGYQYDFYGRLANEIYPHAIGETDNSTLNYVYDDYGYPVKKYLGTTLIWEAKQYAEQGQLSKYILGNNITVTKEFDNQGRLTNITGLKGSNTYQNMSYGYRGDGNIHFRTDATNSVNKKEWFKYDTQNRLIGWETTSLNSAEPEYQTRISYEGNRISQKENIGNYGYSGFPHHGVKSSGVTTITNNALGISYDHNRIDGRARVSSIISGNNSVTYTHGTSDELIKKTETKNGNTYTTYYAGGGKYELRIDNNNVETKLSYLGSGVVKYDTPGTTEDKILYLLKDHLGSVIKVLSINNNSITVEENFSYDVWGNRRNPTTWANTNITTPIYIYKGFTGHEHIEGFGLIHMRGRVYDPALGLFLSPDPYVQSMTAQGFNRYSYCMGNPLMYTDPSGEFILASILVGGFVNWALNGGKFTTRGLMYFGIGALSGAVGGVAGTAVSAAIGITGTSIASILSGAASLGTSGAVGGLINGAGNAWVRDATFGQGMLNGVIAAGIGGSINVIIGGISGGVNFKKEMLLFRKGYALLDIEEDISLPVTDEFLLKAQKAWYAKAPMDKVKIFTVENVPERIQEKLTVNKAGAATSALKNSAGKLTGYSNVYFNKDLAFSSAKQLFYAMGHEFIHVSQYAALIGRSSDILTPEFREMLDFWAYSYECSLGSTNQGAFTQADAIRFANSSFSDWFLKLNYINFDWTNYNSFIYHLNLEP